MSNERTANGGRLTRAMHKAAAALYAATVLGGGSDSGAEGPQESVLGHSETPQVQQEGQIRVECNEAVPDIPSDRHSQGGGSDASEGALQGQLEGVSDSSGIAQR